eukprot:GHVU01101509.1.p1 GENE.GHVU01101509.1~~GHVU01101509.1.p1  ORF type:complete len:243 (-),score=36.99 GHVU01101509.1:110-838(-)
MVHSTTAAATASDDTEFLAKFRDATVTKYRGSECMLLSFSAAEKSKFDIDDAFISGRRKKILSYAGSNEVVIVTPFLEAPFGCSSFDGSKFTLPLSLPTTKNRYTSSRVDLAEVASFKKLLVFMEKQVRMTGDWHKTSNYLPIIRESTDLSKWPERLRIKVDTETAAFYDGDSGAEIGHTDVAKHSACVCALRLSPIWRMPDGRYGVSLEVIRADVFAPKASDEGLGSPMSGQKCTVIEATP